jgi:hypothetical protein
MRAVAGFKMGDTRAGQATGINADLLFFISFIELHPIVGAEGLAGQGERLLARVRRMDPREAAGVHQALEPSGIAGVDLDPGQLCSPNTVNTR